METGKEAAEKVIRAAAVARWSSPGMPERHLVKLAETTMINPSFIASVAATVHTVAVLLDESGDTVTADSLTELSEAIEVWSPAR